MQDKAGLYDPVQMRITVHSFGRPNSDQAMSREVQVTGAQFVRLAYGLPEPPPLEMNEGSGEVMDSPPQKEPSWKLAVKVSSPSGGASMSLAELLGGAWARVLSEGGTSRSVTLGPVPPAPITTPHGAVSASTPSICKRPPEFRIG